MVRARPRRRAAGLWDAFVGVGLALHQFPHGQFLENPQRCLVNFLVHLGHLGVRWQDTGRWQPGKLPADGTPKTESANQTKRRDVRWSWEKNEHEKINPARIHHPNWARRNTLGLAVTSLFVRLRRPMAMEGEG